jgi:tRNA dimethylallyltransferase
VPHHLIDVVDPDEAFSAAGYARRARGTLAEIRARGALPLVVGGTGLYLRALLSGLFVGPSRDEAVRRRLERLADRYGDQRLHRLLARVDPEAAARIEVRDRVRVVRALEVFRATGRPLSQLHRTGSEPLEGFEVTVLGLSPARDVLRQAVEQRTRAMLAAGLIDEVRGLLARYPPDLPPLRAIGYRQAVAVIRGQQDLEEAARDIVKETMRYAKRQMTWFRHQATVTWLSGPDELFAAATALLTTPPA